MNNRFVLTQAESMATRLKNHTDDPHERIRLSFLLCYGRVPDARERKAAESFLSQFPASGSDPEMQALTTYCHSLLASAEFRYLN